MKPDLGVQLRRFRGSLLMLTGRSVPTDVDSQESLNNLVKVISKEHDLVDILFANGNWPARRLI
jgi:hypothetical protein